MNTGSSKYKIKNEIEETTKTFFVQNGYVSIFSYFILEIKENLYKAVESKNSQVSKDCQFNTFVGDLF